MSFNFNLGETANLLRASVKNFASREIAPLAAEIDRSNQFPQVMWKKLGEMGLLGITVEEWLKVCLTMAKSGASLTLM